MSGIISGDFGELVVDVERIETTSFSPRPGYREEWAP